MNVFRLRPDAKKTVWPKRRDTMCFLTVAAACKRPMLCVLMISPTQEQHIYFNNSLCYPLARYASLEHWVVYSKMRNALENSRTRYFFNTQ